jgi:hypothetical protein
MKGTGIVRVFDRTAAMTCASEKALRRADRPFYNIYSSDPSRLLLPRSGNIEELMGAVPVA